MKQDRLGIDDDLSLGLTEVELLWTPEWGCAADRCIQGFGT